MFKNRNLITFRKMKKTYKHDKYNKALTTLLALVKADLPQFMIYIIGVSRVGKTTLQKDLIRELSGEWRQKIIRFEAPPKMTTQFTFKPFLLRYLAHLGDPFALNVNRSYRRMKNNELVDLIVKRIKQFGIKLVIIDEADLFVSARGLSQAYENLQFLKSLVNITEIPHIFAGTPELGEFLAMEGQVINRSHVVQLAPYSLKNSTHVGIFLQILAEFEKDLSIPVATDLKKRPVILFEATNGCVGALKELLVRMEALALAHGLKEISAQLIELFGYYDPANVRSEEIDEFYTSNSASTAKGVPSESLRNSRKREWKKSNPKPRRRPGRRKSPRDEVGGDL